MGTNGNTGCCSTPVAVRRVGQTQQANNTAAQDTKTVTYRPAIDILENDEAFTVIADVPGAIADSIDVTYEDGTLTIHASAPPRQPDDTSYGILEYGVGDYQRALRVGRGIDTNAITAALRDGVLTLTLPKSSETKPRRIDVSVN